MALKTSIICLLLGSAAVDQGLALARSRKDRPSLGFITLPHKGSLAFASNAKSTSPASQRSINGKVDVFDRRPTYDRGSAARMFAADVSGGAMVSVPGKPPLQAAAAADPSASTSSGGVPIGGSIFNLIKNVVGAGILAIPGGVTAFSQSEAAVLPATAMILALGSMSGYCFSLIGRVCAATGASSYGEAWSKTVGPKTSWLPTSSCTAKTFFACMAYSIIIGDVFSDVLVAFRAPGILAARTNILCLVSATVLLPLCLLKDLSALSITSILGVLGTVYTAAVMVIRFFDKSYVEGGRFFAGLADGAKPVFAGSGKLNPLALILVSMLSTAFVAHFNAPKFYSELKDKTVPRFNAVVGSSFAVAIGLVVVMTLFPFLTFGGASKSFILNNYATSDRLATTCRLAIAASIVGGYPLVFMGAKTGALAAFGMTTPTETQRKLGSTLLLFFFTLIGVVLNDLGFVVSFGGAVLGSALVFIFPTMMWISKCKADAKNGKALKGWRRAEIAGNYVIAGMGVVLAVLGGGLSIKKSFF